MMLIQAAAVSVFAQHKPQVVDTLHFDIKLKESDDLPLVLLSSRGILRFWPRKQKSQNDMLYNQRQCFRSSASNCHLQEQVGKARLRQVLTINQYNRYISLWNPRNPQNPDCKLL